MGVASLRISSLLLKLNYQSGDLDNARTLVARASSYVAGLAARMRGLPRRRIGMPFVYFMPPINISIPGCGGGSSSSQCSCSITVFLDNKSIRERKTQFVYPGSSDKMNKKGRELLKPKAGVP